MCFFLLVRSRDSSSVSKRWQTWEAIGSNRFWPKRSQEKTIWFPSCLHGCIASFQLCCDSYHLLGRSSCLTLHIWSLVYNDWRHCECLPSLPNFHCCAKVSREENAAADIRKKYRNDLRESWYGQQQPATPEIGGQIRLYRISTKGQIVESLESHTGILEKFRGLHLFLEYLRAIVSLYLSYILTIFFFFFLAAKRADTKLYFRILTSQRGRRCFRRHTVQSLSVRLDPTPAE